MSEVKKPEPRPQVVIDEFLTRQVAAAMMDGKSFNLVAKELNLSNRMVRQIAASKKFQDICAQVGQDELGPAVAAAKRRMAKLTGKAMDVIERRLEDDDLQAALAVLKGIGMDTQVEKVSDTSITVVMPGAKPVEHVDSMVIEVPND